MGALWRERLKSSLRSSLGSTNLERSRVLVGAYHDLRRTFHRLPPGTFPIGIDEIREACVEFGIKEGDMLHVHSSVRHLRSGSTKPPRRPVSSMPAYASSIVDLLLELVGPTGTLTMATDFDRPPGSLKRMVAGQELPDDVFDPSRHPSKRGLISETFRKRRDVIRSVYPFYNITAWGRHAEELLKDYHRSTPYAQDVHSPWYKMTSMGGKVLLLGRTFDVNSLIHLVEYLHPDEYPRPMFMSRPVSMGYLDRDGVRKNVDVLLHISGTALGPLYTTQGLITFAHYCNERYGIYRIKEFSSGAQIVCYDAKAQYDAVYQEMKRNVAWCDAQFFG